MPSIIEEMEAAGATEAEHASIDDWPDGGGKQQTAKSGRHLAPKDETKRERYYRVIEPRVNKALKAINFIGRMGGSNKGAYDFGDSDTEMVIAALKDAVDEVERRLRRKPTQIPMFILPRQHKNGGAD